MSTAPKPQKGDLILEYGKLSLVSLERELIDAEKARAEEILKTLGQSQNEVIDLFEKILTRAVDKH